jgi:hypothetical protein
VVGDLLDLDSTHRVIAGCETMYFGTSFRMPIWSRRLMHLRHIDQRLDAAILRNRRRMKPTKLTTFGL